MLKRLTRLSRMAGQLLRTRLNCWSSREKKQWLGRVRLFLNTCSWPIYMYSSNKKVYSIQLAQNIQTLDFPKLILFASCSGFFEVPYGSKCQAKFRFRQICTFLL